MAKITKYIKKNGTASYKTDLYLGVDPLTGKKKRTTVRDHSLKGLKLKIATMQLKIDKEGFQNDEITYFKELYELWFYQHCKNIQPTTQQRIKHMFDNHILPKMGHLKIKKITPIFCQKTMNHWAEILATFKNMKTYVSLVFKYGMLLGIVDFDPMSKIITPKSNKKIETKESEKFYTKPQLQYFFDCLEKLNDNRAIAFFRILAFTGARKGEVLALNWGDIDFEKKTITFNKTLVEMQNGDLRIQPPKTEASERTVSLDDISISILKNWKSLQSQKKLAFGIREEDSHSIVICNSILYNKKKYLYKSYPNEIMNKVCRYFPDITKIKIHGFRHTHASLLFEAGAEIKDVQERLGHSDIQTTMNIYTHVTPARKEKTGEQFAKYVNF
ncbi:tyrosine-type recombinase/integrase [Carnobacterium maltaromaticum]|uniref:tyrosine-type recombinase/integrase n=1 Tax=Carnobacterium maltaromaticum TaxID=2751 RepID=UPI0012FCE1D5|nr:site-specific integrase [Carnobacterium maltaromaticum]